MAGALTISSEAEKPSCGSAIRSVSDGWERGSQGRRARRELAPQHAAVLKAETAGRVVATDDHFAASRPHGRFEHGPQPRRSLRNGPEETLRPADEGLELHDREYGFTMGSSAPTLRAQTASTLRPSAASAIIHTAPWTAVRASRGTTSHRPRPQAAIRRWRPSIAQWIPRGLLQWQRPAPSTLYVQSAQVPLKPETAPRTPRWRRRRWQVTGAPGSDRSKAVLHVRGSLDMGIRPSTLLRN
jgi:hypothetical protein